MRIEGFVSLMVCVMLLFILSFGVAALTRELGEMLPEGASASQQLHSQQAAPSR
jgi:hypothetical protein